MQIPVMDKYIDEASGEEYIDYVLKPKRYYTYCYKNIF